MAYVDESGDEGFNFARGSSEWFVLSAVVATTEQDHRFVDLLDRTRTAFKMKGRHQIHVCKLGPSRKDKYTQLIASEPMVAINILVHKPSIAATTLVGKDRLYFYSTRWLLERVSWLCRDKRPKNDPGDGTVRIVFSYRSGTPYPELLEYLQRLQTTPTAIEWGVIDYQRVETRQHAEICGLQVADAVAHAFYCAALGGHLKTGH